MSADFSKYANYNACDYADNLGDDSFMDYGIRAIWDGCPRIVGPAYTVKCEAGDNLALHTAIYRAPIGSIIVCQAGDHKFAVAGGNVCMTAQQNGIAGFVIDGVSRDLGETRDAGFPVYARGTVPKPGKKGKKGELEGTVTCGGIEISQGDIIIADEEGIVCIPKDQADEIFAKTEKSVAKNEAQSLGEWRANHQAKIEGILAKL